MSNLELNLKRLAAVRESVPHFFFPALAAEPRTDEPEQYPEEPVVIPTSVLYTYSKPIAWYEFSKAHQSVKRIERPKNTTLAMKEYFVTQQESAPVEDVYACFIQPCDPALARHSSLQHVLSDVVTQTYGGEAGLLHFLQQSKGKGLLQAFVENKPETDGSTYNAFYICSYSPATFSVEKARGRTSVDQKRGASSIALENRFSPHHDSYEVVPLLSWALQRRLRKVCANVVHRLQTRTNVVVSHMNLVCRATRTDELVVLWCDSLNVHYASEPNIRYRITPAGTDSIVVKAGIERPLAKVRADPIGASSCSLCQNELQTGLLCRVNIRWLLLALSFMDVGVTGWRETTPPSVALLLPEMTRDDFEMMKRTGDQLREFKLVCEECLDRCEVAVARLSEEKRPAPEWLHVDDAFREGRIRKGHQARTAASVVRVLRAEDPLQRAMRGWLCKKAVPPEGSGGTPVYDCSGPVWREIGSTDGPTSRQAADHVVPNRLLYMGIDGNELMAALRDIPMSRSARDDQPPPPPPPTPHVY